MNDPTKWLNEHSPYRLHKGRRAEFTDAPCCGERIPDGSEVYCFDPLENTQRWLPLYRCVSCGRWWIASSDRWKEIQNPLQFPRRSKTE